MAKQAIVFYLHCVRREGKDVGGEIWKDSSTYKDYVAKSEKRVVM